MMRAYDCIVIGAGISGASAAYELALNRRVLLLERESLPGYHSTGRSAALFTPGYGSAVIRKLAAASWSFFNEPPAGFSAVPLLRDRGGLTMARRGRERLLEIRNELPGLGSEVRELTPGLAGALAPMLRTDAFVAALYQPGIKDMDVHAIHAGFLRGFKARSGGVICDARVEMIKRDGEFWQIHTRTDVFSAVLIVNAAGAWAEEIGQIAGACRIGLTPMRRTAILLDVPEDMTSPGLPVVDVAGEEPYFKPEGPRLMASLGDATPTEAQDAQPDEVDIAVLASWLEEVTLLRVERIAARWAGLRSFVADSAPVVGFDPCAPNFLWLAGQGGYGIMIAPALARAVASLVNAGSLPDDFADHGISDGQISPDRLMPN